MYQPLDLPAGMSSNGTVYQNRQLWYYGDRVRWHHGALRPIGGWNKFSVTSGNLDQVLTDPANQKSRAALSWKSNDGTNYYVIGHNQGLKAFNRALQTVYDITPSEFTPQPSGPIVSNGYGNWFYGTDDYGNERQYEEASSPIFNWCFRNWGQNLLAGERGNPSNLYVWDLTFATPATKIVQAPENFDCFHVTAQRIVMTAGDAIEPRLIKWSTSEDYTDWVPTNINQAGFQTLGGNGRFKEIIDFRDQILLVSETDVYTCRYLGPPYIFGFDQVGQDCGVATGAAVVATEDFVVWPGSRDFFIYDGTVRRLNCTVIDAVVDLLDSVNWGKTVGFVNTEWSEIWWLYQSDASSDDVDAYIVWDYNEDHWVTGTLDRTVGEGTPVTEGPIMMKNDGYLYQHEVPNSVPSDHDSAADVYVESGPLEFKGGDATQYISAIQPDFISGGAVNVYLIGQDRPTGPETVFGPYNISYPANSSQPIPCRARGHTVRLRIEGDSSTWELGSLRINLLQNGGRK